MKASSIGEGFGSDSGFTIFRIPRHMTLEVPGGADAHEEIVLSGFSRRG